jgi:hypothetical protein
MKKFSLLVKKRIGLVILFLFWVTFVLVFTNHLTKFPIFEDEAINLLLSERLSINPLGNFFVFMRHGFLPALGWFIFVVRLFIEDSLFAGRLLNVLLASSLFFWLYLIKKEYKLPIGFFVLSSVLFLFSPILVLNSRVVLFDTPVMVFSAWTLYLFTLILKKPRLIFEILFFIVFLSCLLIKFTSLFILPSLIFLVFMKYRKTKKLKEYKRQIFLLLLTLFCFGLIIAPFYLSISGDLKTGLVFNLNAGAIFARIYHNFWLFLNWSYIYYPSLSLSILFFVTLILDKREVQGRDFSIALLIWFAVSLLTMVLFNRFYYPRHILVLLIPLYVIPVFVLQRYPLVISVAMVTFLVLIRLVLFGDLIFDTTYTKAKIAKEDRFQYFEDYTSGIEIDDIAKYLSEKAENKKVVVWLDGSWVMEYGVRRALKATPNIEFKSFVDFESQRFGIPGKVSRDGNKPGYVIANKYKPLNMKDLTLERQFSWMGYHPVYLYAITPQ